MGTLSRGDAARCDIVGRGTQLLFATFLLLGRPAPAEACASAAPARVPPIEIRGEEALIVWDEANKEEHFVRLATFDAKTKSFGFLVPTPTRPALAEASAKAFDALRDATKPEEVTRTSYRLAPSLLFMFAQRSSPLAASAAMPPSAVTVLEEKRVAGMDATVIAATDVDELANWLERRQFEMRPALREWLAPYVAANFTVTAFRYERPDVAANGDLGAAAPLTPKAVRLTFKTDAPFYPYREPSDAPVVPGRRLDLFLVGATRLDGTLGAARSSWSTASAAFADAIDTPVALSTALTGVTLPKTVHVTRLVDRADKRVAEDLSFSAGNTTRVRPPPIVTRRYEELFLPLEALLPVGLGVWLWRRKRQRMSAP